jgi:hypothetical protein
MSRDTVLPGTGTPPSRGVVPSVPSLDKVIVPSIPRLSRDMSRIVPRDLSAMSRLSGYFWESTSRARALRWILWVGASL